MESSIEDILIEKFGLSRREAEVAVLTSRGHTNRETGRFLFVTEKTVKFHLTNIFRKTSVKSRAQLIVMVMKVVPTRTNGFAPVITPPTPPVNPAEALPTGSV